MNHIYRLIWSHVLNAWVAVSENAKGRGKSSGKGIVLASLLLSQFSHASPIGGQVVSGIGTISQSGAVTTIDQSEQNLSLNWKSFNFRD